MGLDVLTKMGKSENNLLYRRLLRSYLSSVVSISLVLFFVGLAGLVVVNAHSVSDFFKENITVSVILGVEASDEDASEMVPEIEKFPFVKEVTVITKQQGVKEMQEMLGEDFMDVFEVNPIPVSLDLKINADYISSDSLAVVEALLGKVSMVSDVVYRESLVELLNANLEKIAIVLGIFVALLLFISVVLINNTVRLNVYSKRFTIHTMRLVGATKGFISRPFVGQAFFQGLIAGAVADTFLLLALHFVRDEFYQIFSLFTAGMLGSVMAGVILLGVIICMVSTAFVVRNLISLTKDELY